MRAVEGTHVPAALLGMAAKRVQAELGLQFDGARHRQFEAALGRMAAALQHPSARHCAAWLLAGAWDEARSTLCARFLTVGETYFFREPHALDLLCEQARAHALSQAARPLRIWSAGCCTGEEPYSIAMALRRRVPQLAPQMVSILATDLNERFIAFARTGVYRRWSFRRTDPADLAAWFRPRGDGLFEIAAALRAQVSFAQLNLAGAGYPSAATATQGLDLIFCRNVLMYFGRKEARRVIARLRDSLVEGGWLVVNASEASVDLYDGFTPVWNGDALFFRKEGMVSQAKQAVPVPMPVPLRSHLPAGRAARPAMLAPPAVPVPAPSRADDAVLARATHLAAAGDREGALQCLRRAVEGDPLSAPLQLGVALFSLEHGATAMARDGVRRLLYLEPGSAIGHYLAALLEDGAGRQSHARHLLAQCLALSARDGAGGAFDCSLAGSAARWLERMR